MTKSYFLSSGEHLGYRWLVLHNGMGYRCGYVRVPKGHPWHGKEYSDINILNTFYIHGGLTYGDSEAPEGDDKDDGYWFGFDCGHIMIDGQDMDLPRDPRWFEMPVLPGQVVRTQDYVEAQCRRLCEQAAFAAVIPSTKEQAQ